ncbi:hypothetical protein QA645_17050 [Bradyrhizobium sp. CIAT3101]|uniref:hypothetical protein n=1 Tax=Bradyrhizobium sp. CIAT3101 TaxID=439387 RepID=UPI0024B0F4CF|nr:hypothetical protein [Bradyrhizobium sp. CIAT3101]WFU84380.1 hypothetical protein QA645_17050 [Bradyrhizobium sp. CIAT3101]
MSTTDAVRSEVERFLRSPDPEVLCITGEWGVGKTYMWQSILDRLRIKREVGLWRYSYVSLFGVGSLDVMRTAIFENMEVLAPQGGAGYEWLVSGGSSVLKNSKKLVSVASAIPVVGSYVGKAQPLLFSAIRNQIICVDDLERRSGSLSVKDVFGLVSFLREQRGCKVILLLNQSQVDKDETSKAEFADYFEKVIDVKLVYAPSSTDAVSIAIEGNDGLSSIIREHCERLRIANIRVIKKIERLVRMMEPTLSKLDEEVTRQAVHSIAMFGWCKFDAGAKPPPMDYIRQSSLGRYIDRKNSKEAPSADESRWDTILEEYDWGNLDDFDVALLKFVETSLLDRELIEKAAAEAQLKHRRLKKAVSFEQAWRVYHDSFGENDHEVCIALVRGFKENIDVLSKRNLDEVLSILRELGRAADADALIEFAESAASNEFWASDDPFERDIKDARLLELTTKRREVAKPVFDFEQDLVLSAERMDEDRRVQVAAAPVEQYQALFEARTGTELRRAVLSALDYRRIINATENMRTIVAKAEAALRAIGRKSKLNELRIQRYGISIEESSTPEDEGSEE